MKAGSTRHPFSRLVQLTVLDGWEVFVICCFAGFSGVLSLAVPLAAQALVNSIAQGLFVQPLIVLSAAVFAGLAFSGLLKAMQFAISERILERLFARVSLRLTEILRQCSPRQFMEHRGYDQIHHFMEVANIQKSWQKLLLDVPSAVVDMLLSLAFLSLYGSNLWLLSIGVIALSAAAVLILGWGGLSSSIYESKAKYAMHRWLAHLSDHVGESLRSSPASYWYDETDIRTCEYVKYRRSHYYVLLRQKLAFYGLRATMGCAVLGLGGWLVIQGSLSVGQLVAAEIVVLNLLKSAEKLILSASSFYDLLTGLDKLGHLTDLTPYSLGNQELASKPHGLAVLTRSLSLRYRPEQETLTQLDLDIAPGERVSVVSGEGEGRSTLAAILAGQMAPTLGHLELDGIDYSTIQIDSWMGQCAWLHEGLKVLPGTLETNLRLGREASPHDVRWALQFSGLHEHLSWLPKGLKTELSGDGRELSSSQRERLLLARAVLTRPRLFLLDRGLDSLGVEELPEALDRIFDPRQRWTLINFWVHPETLRRSDRILVLHKGCIVESGRPQDLIARNDGYFTRLFPRCTRRLQEEFRHVQAT